MYVIIRYLPVLVLFFRFRAFIVTISFGTWWVNWKEGICVFFFRFPVFQGFFFLGVHMW